MTQLVKAITPQFSNPIDVPESLWNKTNIINTVSIDNVIFGFKDSKIQVLLYRHNFEPHKGQWALPGGYVKIDENIDEAAVRILYDFTGIKRLHLEQLRAFGESDRTPDNRTITIVYQALIRSQNLQLSTGADASELKWFDLDEVPDLIFDHNVLIAKALQRLRTQMRYEPIGFNLLPSKFTLGQLRSLYEAITERKIEKSNFRRKILKMDLLIKLEEKEEKVNHRAGWMYKFDKKRYNLLTKKGFNFEV